MRHAEIDERLDQDRYLQQLQQGSENAQKQEFEYQDFRGIDPGLGEEPLDVIAFRPEGTYVRRNTIAPMPPLQENEPMMPASSSSPAAPIEPSSSSTDRIRMNPGQPEQVPQPEPEEEVRSDFQDNVQAALLAAKEERAKSYSKKDVQNVLLWPSFEDIEV